MAIGTQQLQVLVGIPTRAAWDEAQLRRLVEADVGGGIEIADSAERFAARLPDADVAMIWPSFAPMLAPALCPGGRLRWVQVLTAGINGVLTPEVVAAEHVALTSSKGPLGPLMAEHAVMLMLALARDLPGFLRDQAGRRWQPIVEERPMKQIFGKTIFILGLGAVGGSLARMCQLGFGMRVLGMARTRRDDPHVDRWVERSDMATALGQADVVALCLALTAATARIVDAAALAAMRPTAYLVNVARGGLVDEPALAEALRAGRLAGAGLDVTAVEPLPEESPLWGLPNVIITPHVSPARDRVDEYLVDFWLENLHRFRSGVPLLGPVDRSAGY